MTAEEKAKVDIKKIARIMRNVLCVSGIVMIGAYYLSIEIEKDIINQVGFYGGLVGGVLLLLVLTSNEVHK